MLLRSFRFTVLFVAALFLSAAAAAQDDIHRIEVRNPAATPERVLLNIAADPAHTQTVTWRTETAQDKAEAQIAEASAHPDFTRSARSVPAAAKSVELSAGKSVGEYAVQFTGLKPDTRYAYRVGGGNSWSEWYEFRTASAVAASFRFLYLGDAQNSIRSLWSRAVRAAYAAAPDARFVVHAGDLVAEGYDDTLWGEWFDAMGFIAGTVPSMPVPGNHDMHRGPNVKGILDSPPAWRAQFSLPHNGPAGIPELDQHTYYVDYQGLRIISLDVNVYANEDFSAADKKRIADAQTAWLEQVLRENPNPWTIVVQHQPIFTVSKERDYAEMRAVLEPLYDKYHVALVLQGHDHAYARSLPLVAGKVVAAGQGTIYAITVSGPKMYANASNFDALMAKQLRNTQMFQVIEVNSNQLIYKALDIEGNLVDEFQIAKPRN
jgi:predicted phosphodiesterase